MVPRACGYILKVLLSILKRLEMESSHILKPLGMDFQHSWAAWQKPWHPGGEAVEAAVQPRDVTDHRDCIMGCRGCVGDHRGCIIITRTVK